MSELRAISRAELSIGKLAKACGGKGRYGALLRGKGGC